MAAQKPQSFENHAKIVPGYHYGVFGILVLYLLGNIWLAITDFSIQAVMMVLLAVALLGLFLYARLFPLRVQDRVIRLEMRLRLHEVLPADLRPRISELRVRQLIALRFASDAELPGLVRAVLDEGLREPKEIKRRIKDWQADNLRA